MAAEFHERRGWFDRYREDSETGGRVALPILSELYTCPCCGYPMLSERYAYEICPLCWWEDAGEDDHDLDSESGPNHITLREGRANFEQYLLSSPPHGGRTLRGINDERAIKKKRRAVEALDAIHAAGSTEEILALIEDDDDAFADNNVELRRLVDDTG